MEPPIQETRASLRIVQIETEVVYILMFPSGAIQAYVCQPEDFSLNLDVSPNDVRNLLRDNQDLEEDG